MTGRRHDRGAARRGARGCHDPIGSATHGRRLLGVGLAFTLLAVAYGVRLFDLQVRHGSELRARADAQSATEEEIRAPRGRILDREGRPLVVDDARYRAFLAPRELAVGREAAIEAIDDVVGLTRAQRSRLLAAESGWAPLPRPVTDEERSRLRGVLRSGLHFTAVSSRTYPLGDVARRLVGKIDGEGNGLTGLELELDHFLRGRPGAILARRDANGGRYWIPDAPRAQPVAGHDVVLTIDASLQRIAEHELDRALAETGAQAGDIVLLDPRTGELLAVASERDDAAPERIPAFTDPYEPGSTLKPFLLAALLSEEAARLDEVLDVERGELQMGRRRIRDVHAYDTLSVAEVVIYSSNVGAAKLSGRLRSAVQHRYLRDFGFGMPSGIEYPAESSGRLARPAEWTALSPASLAMGYEIAVTSLQLASAYGALANDGVLMQPRLIRNVRSHDGSTIASFEPQEIRRVVRPEVAREVTEVLRRVVKEGTGTLARMASLAVAGKTGTARLTAGNRYAVGRYRASFVGYAPVEDPQVVILARLEDPRGRYYGGAVAAPTSQATLEAALATQGVRLDDGLLVRSPEPRRWGQAPASEEASPYVFAVGTTAEPWSRPAARGAPQLVLPDLSGLPLRSAVARLHELGLRVELEASGRVSAQTPRPGSKLAPGATVVLR